MATPVIMPKQGNSVESCVIVEWKKQVGETVEQGEVLCEIETDKAVMEVESPASGILLVTYFPSGAEVAVMTPIAVVGEAGEVVEEVKPAHQRPGVLEQAVVVHQKSAQPQPLRSTHPKPISPRARRLAREQGIGVGEVQGSGPGGRVLERDVLRAQTISVVNPLSQTDYPGATAVPLKGIRKRTAERMLHSLQNTAQLTLNASADARSLLEWRTKCKASSDPEAQAISLNDLILFAVARTLLAHLELNALLESDTIFQFASVNLGFAVDTPRGLLVPVVKEAQALGLRELSRQTKQFALECQDGHIAPESLQGGTFTVSNLGQFGIEQFTPILNPPQVGILGVGNINLKPIQTAGGVEFQPHLGLSLTVNHQVVDGAPAARFLQTLSHNLADLTALLALQG